MKIKLLQSITKINWVKSALNLAIVLMFLSYFGHWQTFPTLERLDQVFYDLKLKMTMPNTLDPRIVIVDIDEKSLAAEGHWPWSRNKLAYMNDMLFDYYQIKLVAFDILFSEADDVLAATVLDQLKNNDLSSNEAYLQAYQKIKPTLEYDRIFSESMVDRDVVLSFFTVATPQPVNPLQKLPEPVAARTEYDFFAWLIAAQSYGGNIEIIQKAAASAGFFNNLSVDKDGVYRHLPLLAVYRNGVYQALSLAIYRQYLESAPLEFIANTDYDKNEVARLEGLKAGDYIIPVDEKGSIIVPYRGRQGSFNYYSATDVLNGLVDVDALKDKIVIVGTTATGLMDLRSTPVQSVYPGVEVHANIVSGLLDRTIKSKPSYMTGYELLQSLLISFFALFIFSRFQALVSTLFFLLLLMAIVGINVYLWQNALLETALATPVIQLAGLFLMNMTFGYFQESQRKKLLGDMFGQYVPTELVEQMIQSGERFTVSGESKNMTVLFSDVRGFTTISEGLDPQALCQLMNEILSPITGVIHQHHGTIDKYMGDAVMAFWGAPLNDPKHAEHALEAALAVLPVLTEVNAAFKTRNWPRIDLGIGLNTGQMSVGNMGSSFRMAYTVLGDAVNLGSRLEGLTKQYGVQIIVSETTREQAPGYTYRELDKVRVKGKNNAITIYEPVGKSDSINENLAHCLQLFEQALWLYRACEWDKASTTLRQLIAIHPERAKLYNLYLERIEHFRETPPEANWDGAFTHTQK